MLILTRKSGEKIVINGNIVIEVTGISGGKVKIGVSAPQDVTILRSELKLKKTASRPPLEEDSR